MVLYGQNLFFDVSMNVDKPTDFASRIYKVAKFTDLITLPRLMTLYGVSNLNYINTDYAPYPAIYYEVRNQADVNRICRSNHNVGGCSIFHFNIVLLDDAIAPTEQTSRWYARSRNETDDHLYYRETIAIRS